MELFNLLKGYSIRHIRPKPAKRVYIPKKNGKVRPLGIPIIKDRIFQNIVKNALEPQWEVRFEPSSYGFRPKRSTIDAITSIHLKLKGRSTREWIFEGDFKGCFDNLNHQHIMDCIKAFPAKEAVQKWLKAGYVDNDTFNETGKGTPQGGVISPLLANIALYGMEDELGIKYWTDRGRYYLARNSVGIVKYADDFVIVCKTKEEAESMYTKLSPYLENRGLELAKEKTRVTHITEGFDFLGFTCRKFKTNRGTKLLIKPSKESIKKDKGKIKQVFKQLRGHSARDLIMELNPIVRGIGNYWSSQVAKKIFTNMDMYVWIKVRKHLKTLHSKKSFKWIYKKYFKPDYTGASKSKWILTDPNDNKTQLFNMSWIPIVRHAMITFKNSPDDAKLKEYFEERDRKEFERDNVLSRRKLAKCSNYKCRVCKQSLVGKKPLKINQIVPENLDGDERYSNLELLHEGCLEQHTKLLIEYGGGRDLPKIRNFFKNRQVESNSPEGYRLMKDAFRKFKYQYV